MSNIPLRGWLPPVLAIVLGVSNGYFVFKPSLKEQQAEKELKAQEIAKLSEEGSEYKTVRDAEATASRIVATSAALKPATQSKSWWASLWPGKQQDPAKIPESPKIPDPKAPAPDHRPK